MLMRKKNSGRIGRGFFITGTDTGVGKTRFAVTLLDELRAFGFRTVALKPVAAGCALQQVEDGRVVLQNGDALLLQQHATQKLPYTAVNPIALRDPVAPHIAAARVGQELGVAEIVARSYFVLHQGYGAVDYVVIEGAGGWLVPLNQHETMADLAYAYGYPIVVVVGMRLGCINHAGLTFDAITRAGFLPVAGWVANVIDPDMRCIDENIAAIAQRYPAIPLLRVIPYAPSKLGEAQRNLS
jgi:dethiobiotin synthetase